MVDARAGELAATAPAHAARACPRTRAAAAHRRGTAAGAAPRRRRAGHRATALDRAGSRARRRAAWLAAGARSEEHTSELQSLMRNSYAVLCLKKKNHTHTSAKNVHILHRTIQ